MASSSRIRRHASEFVDSAGYNKFASRVYLHSSLCVCVCVCVCVCRGGFKVL